MNSLIKNIHSAIMTRIINSQQYPNPIFDGQYIVLVSPMTKIKIINEFLDQYPHTSSFEWINGVIKIGGVVVEESPLMDNTCNQFKLVQVLETHSFAT